MLRYNQQKTKEIPHCPACIFKNVRKDKKGLKSMWDFMTPIEFLQNDKTAQRVFDSVERARGKASGWFVAKDSEINPETAASTLKHLKDLGVVASTGPGLDGFYYLTDLGIKVRNVRVHAAAG